WRAVALSAVTPSCCMRSTTCCRTEAILLTAGACTSRSLAPGARARVAAADGTSLALALIPSPRARGDNGAPAATVRQTSTSSAITLTLIGLLEKLTHVLQQRGFGIGEIAARRQTHRITREVAFVQQLPRAEGSADDVPRQPEELNALP